MFWVLCGCNMNSSLTIQYHVQTINILYWYTRHLCFIHVLQCSIIISINIRVQSKFSIYDHLFPQSIEVPSYEFLLQVDYWTDMMMTHLCNYRILYRMDYLIQKTCASKPWSGGVRPFSKSTFCEGVHAARLSKSCVCTAYFIHTYKDDIPYNNNNIKSS